ncbi:hypothetical protein [Alkalicoccobacillus plakortidis]|uniref:YusW-like protein n=1 Tax=Alkalicoccobacillus plakortidis TaxID=444060 RepID=A0ABT0XGD2_9BACI|nr:hypothetical protein [Alkalicoccobacillus plakortidis]MCM2674947.1 hypothetical protein [Alkalicoccobacillus plakortidis]
MMKKMLLLLSVSMIVLAACGQTAKEADPTETETTEDSNITETPEQIENDDEAPEDTDTEEASENEEATDSDEVAEETSQAEETAVSAGGDASTEEEAEPESDSDSKVEATETDSSELGEDEIADPSYTEVESDTHQEAITDLKDQFSNQLLSIELENGEDWADVYAVVTDGLKLPSDEEREFHISQMAEAITESLDLKTQAPGGTITFVYEDQSVLGTYHTEDGSISYP